MVVYNVKKIVELFFGCIINYFDRDGRMDDLYKSLL